METQKRQLQLDANAITRHELEGDNPKINPETTENNYKTFSLNGDFSKEEGRKKLKDVLNLSLYLRKTIILNISGIQKMDIDTMGIFTTYYQVYRNMGRTLILLAPDNSARYLMNLLGFSTKVEIINNLPTAIQRANSIAKTAEEESDESIHRLVKIARGSMEKALHSLSHSYLPSDMEGTICKLPRLEKNKTKAHVLAKTEESKITPFSLEAKHFEHYSILSIRGDLANQESLLNFYKKFKEFKKSLPPTQNIIINLAALGKITSGATDVLFSICQDKKPGSEQKIVICQPPKAFYQFFEILGLNEHFNVYKSQEEAIKNL